jgi:hypothetical protein
MSTYKAIIIRHACFGDLPLSNTSNLRVRNHRESMTRESKTPFFAQAKDSRNNKFQFISNPASSIKIGCSAKIGIKERCEK